MPPSSPPPAPSHPVHVQIAKAIAEHGWFVTAVGPTEDDPCDPWAYTIGLYRSYDVPELVITGMHDYRNAHAILYGAIEQIQKGRRPGPNVREAGWVGGVARDYDVEFREVSRENREGMLTGAYRWNAYEDYPALQLVWPDPAGVFPWEPNYSRQFIQPILS